MMPANLLSLDANHVTATFDAFFVVVWKRDVTVIAAQAIRNHIKEFAAIVPGGRLALLTVVEVDAPLPSPDARTALANILKSCGRELICSGVAMEGSGFGAAARRAVAIGLSLVAKQPFPHRIFATVGETAAWVSTHFREGPSASGDFIAQTISDVRARGKVAPVSIALQDGR